MSETLRHSPEHHEQEEPEYFDFRLEKKIVADLAIVLDAITAGKDSPEIRNAAWEAIEALDEQTELGWQREREGQV